MRLAPLRLQGLTIARGELKGSAVVNGRLAAGECDLTPALKLLGRLVTGIKQSLCFSASATSR